MSCLKSLDPTQLWRKLQCVFVKLLSFSAFHLVTNWYPVQLWTRSDARNLHPCVLLAQCATPSTTIQPPNPPCPFHCVIFLQLPPSTLSHCPCSHASTVIPQPAQHCVFLALIFPGRLSKFCMFLPPILMPSCRLATNCASLWFILTLSGGFSGQLNDVDRLIYNSKAKLCVCKETTACKLILMPSMQPSIPICRESTAAELYFGPIHCWVAKTEFVENLLTGSNPNNPCVFQWSWFCRVHAHSTVKMKLLCYAGKNALNHPLSASWKVQFFV